MRILLSAFMSPYYENIGSEIPGAGGNDFGRISGLYKYARRRADIFLQAGQFLLNLLGNGLRQLLFEIHRNHRRGHGGCGMDNSEFGLILRGQRGGPSENIFTAVSQIQGAKDSAAVDRFEREHHIGMNAGPDRAVDVQ